MIYTLFSILVFPGLLFLSIFGVIAEFIDRRLYARFQNRMGPPWFQPVADFIKLLAKEELIPEEADARMFKILPVFAVAAAVTAFLYIPLWNTASLFSFEGDIIVVLYLLTLPTLTFFLAGWYSTSLYAMIGAVRTLTQLFAYEVPLFMGILSPAILADSWSLEAITRFYGEHPWYALFNILGFAVSVIAIQGKLERIPFDIPEAETEVVGGAFTEYSGKFLALFRMAIDIEMVVCAALLAAVFLPFGLELHPVISFVIFIVKLLVIIFIMSLMRSIFARLRIDQMVNFCWKYLAPAALLQILISFILKGILVR
ncbi:MAG TPA: NADH-quinone oxidoreductase subunit H [Lentisphaeria bacterium]|nr:MAG: NADH dehydrogenase [Lentisphaerae bacterium GWF2_49_21]HBC86217.1 NADH-quinone oxidoreductase subunit H [Lentisphaeria bacterium]